MPTTASRVIDAYVQRTPKSAELARQAEGTFPGGLVHDARRLKPHPIYVTHARGSRKWDVDGHEYVDYVGGHGALLLGHSHPVVTEAVSQQIGNGTHFGACHEFELRWGEWVQKLVPSAERVRFTSSGTEATMLAFRLARGYTGKSKIVRFATHFHGWQDHAAFGVGSHHDGTPTPGVLGEIADNILLLPPGDIDAVREVFRTRDDIAAVILEPTGATWGQIPLPEQFCHDLRAAASEHDVLLMFDEVVTGFRVSPGGAQAKFGITPDITTLAKVLAGGFPGGAIVGREDVLALLDFEAAASAGFEKIAHHGTYNANPVSAVAGMATLEIVSTTDACDRASDYAARLRNRFQHEVNEAGLNWSIYGAYSGFHIFTNPDNADVSVADLDSGSVDYRIIKAASASPAAAKLRLAMLTQGVDLFGWPGGSVSAVHTDEDLEHSVKAFRQSLQQLREDDDL